jgi:lipoprotein-anchoring transpeptidase ErfK/SrfK
MGSRVSLLVYGLGLLVLSRSASAQSAPAPPPHYSLVIVEGMNTVRALQHQFGAEGYATILRLNRVDPEHVRQGDTLVVPDRVIDANGICPFPGQLSTALSPSEKMLLVSRRVQAFAAYEKGVLVRWGPTSTGRKETPTPAGLFYTNWRAKSRRSHDNDEWVLPWYVNFVNESGVSFHQFALPGYPASHACVRLLDADAHWIYDWADQWVLSENRRDVLITGTPVVVFGEYDYEAPPPWRRLTTDPLAVSVPLAEIAGVLQPNVQTIAERAAARNQRVQ